MNKGARRDSLLSLMLLATPAALAITDIGSAAAAGILSALLLLTFSTLQRVTAGISTPARQTLLLLAGATLAAAADLLLQAFAWPQHQALQWWLPVIAISAFAAHESCIHYRSSNPAIPLGYRMGTAFAAPLLIGVLRTLTDTPVLSSPAAILIMTALAIAIANRYLPRDTNNTDTHKSRRVRVTGPVR